MSTDMERSLNKEEFELTVRGRKELAEDLDHWLLTRGQLYNDVFELRARLRRWCEEVERSNLGLGSFSSGR